MNRLFYCDHLSDGEFKIEGEDHRHSIKVLRLKKGDQIDVIDGTGYIYQCQIASINKKELIASIQSKILQFPLPYSLSIAISPLKNPSRFEWFLEKSTEIGISEIYPIQCKRTEKPGIKYDRSRKIIHSAMKQSLQAYEPTLNPVMKLNEFAELNNESFKIIAYINENVHLTLSQIDLPPQQNYTIVIGPEGGFTQEEAGFMMDLGFQAVSLGNSRLRTETAAIAACQIIKTLEERRMKSN